MRKPSEFQVFVSITCAYAAFLFYLSSLSSPPGLPDLRFLYEFGYSLRDLGLGFLVYPFYLAYRHPDKFAHFALYTVLGMLLHPTLSSSKNVAVNKYAAPFSILIGTLYGITDEFHQTFVPHRSASLMDLCADFLGLLFAQFLILLYFGIKRLIRSKEVRG
ncbi:MAG TPA: hypothetical protein ENI32_05495 [Candidatus Syntrophoarchaeum butanivorans]|uniref:Integral membrane protein n=1 Tax=Candidatus Syntropharchaeum butanivorans TaxID=1839936 RepID=A0A1F2P4T7_9EURY|nr:MAG: integral membrane protein [Candidatus Syntrophoarchaeum butanivorans]HEC57318.1 hypothetical protein [Candidatus Syntrophoarchaeum butanivorans]